MDEPLDICGEGWRFGMDELLDVCGRGAVRLDVCGVGKINFYTEHAYT